MGELGRTTNSVPKLASPHRVQLSSGQSALERTTSSAANVWINVGPIMEALGAQDLQDLARKIGTAAMVRALKDSYHSPHASEVGSEAGRLLLGLAELPDAKAIAGEPASNEPGDYLEAALLSWEPGSRSAEEVAATAMMMAGVEPPLPSGDLITVVQDLIDNDIRMTRGEA